MNSKAGFNDKFAFGARIPMRVYLTRMYQAESLSPYTSATCYGNTQSVVTGLTKYSVTLRC